MTRYPTAYRPLAGLLLLLAAVALGSGACSNQANPDPGATESYQFTRFAMDTVVEYTIHAASREHAFTAMLEAHAEMERVEELLWEKHTGSAVYVLNHGGRLKELPADLQIEVSDFIGRLREYHQETGGRFNPGIGGVLDLYGFGTDQPGVPDPDQLRQALAHSDLDRFTVDPEAKLSVGGVAKGYAVDRAVETLRSQGIRDALVNAGGDLFALGSNAGRPWAIGVAHPDEPGALIDTLFVTDAAVATSGDYQRFFDKDGIRYHHLLDPATGRPVRTVRSATIVAPTAERADALATGLFVAGFTTGRKMLDADPHAFGMIVDPELARLRTAGFDRYTTAERSSGG